MCILMPPCTPHEILASSCTLVHNWVHFHISDFSLYKKLGLPENTFFSVSDSNAITSVFRQCENDMILRKTMWQENCSCLLERCFIGLKRELQETEHTAVLGKSVLHFENFSHGGCNQCQDRKGKIFTASRETTDRRNCLDVWIFQCISLYSAIQNQNRFHAFRLSFQAGIKVEH